jgi:hypothetical protein
MTNANLIRNEGKDTVLISCREEDESNDKGWVQVKHPITGPVFVYIKETGERISGISYYNNLININQSYLEVVVDYCYSYNKGYDILTFGHGILNGYLSLEGKMRVKDDTTGQVVTGIIKIPKLKLLSNLSMRLG